MMTKEERINMLLEMLANEVMGDSTGGDLSPEIIILSKNEAQIIESPGNLPTNLVFDGKDPKLRKLISVLVNYNYSREYNNWRNEAEKESGVKIKNCKYDPTLCPDHIFHTIEKLDEFSKLHLWDDLQKEIDLMFKKLNL